MMINKLNQCGMIFITSEISNSKGEYMEKIQNIVDDILEKMECAGYIVERDGLGLGFGVTIRSIQTRKQREDSNK